MTNWEFSLDCARKLDENDKLSTYRDRFFIPNFSGKESLYFTGNSLGLQPKSVQTYIQKELDDWSKWGVEGHEKAKTPWLDYHEIFNDKISPIVGAKNKELVVTHSLTTNLHLLLISFYRPTKKRFKILCEKKAFPSDQYALQSQTKIHNLNPEDCIVEIGPRGGEHTIRTEDIISKINEVGQELALVMIGGVNYYSGQVFDMESITTAGHKVGAYVGFDLAHGVGNIPIKLNQWNVDFAAWCSYKYLNSGPGGVSGLYVNEKHVSNPNILRLAGWWGHNKEDRFKMPDKFSPIPTAESWQLSNAPVLAMAAHKASVDLFNEVGMEKLREKSISLTGYLEFIVHLINKKKESFLEIITPNNFEERGCQLSIIAHGNGKELFDELSKNHIVVDWREPNVIRVAPVPFYNSFQDVYEFGRVLNNYLS